jgi:four helix bundle protein
MSTYRDLEAYQLARRLVAGACSTVPGDSPSQALRHAAVSAAARIAEGSSQPDKGSFLAGLHEAADALAEFAARVEDCRRQGALDPVAAEALLQRQTEAAAALSSLISAASPAPCPDPARVH